MSTVLLSTTSGWNAGDDWIREGLLRVLRLRHHVNTIWWNRGWGIERTYGNAARVNLPLADYVIIAGTPEWIERTESVYHHCVSTGTKMALLGVGKTGGYSEERHGELMKKVVDAELIEIAIARDEIAAETLSRIGIGARVMCDPAVFLHPSLPGRDNRLVVGWRGLGEMKARISYEGEWDGADHQLSTYLWEEWERAKDRDRIVVVHDNREVAAAREMFGTNAVMYSSDPDELRRRYSRCGHYVGARIHGFVAALVHGASAHLIYHNQKARCAQTIIDRLELEGSAAVTITDEGQGIPELELRQPENIWRRINKEMNLFRRECMAAPGLARLMEVKR